MKKVRRRFRNSLAMLLVATFVLQMLPLNALAAALEETAKNVTVMYGDIDGNGTVINRDLVLMQRYVNGWSVTVDEVAADVNHDGGVNNRDLTLLQRYINGWNVSLEPVVKTYSVHFYDGDRLIDTLTAEKDQPLGAVPAVEKSSKANAILLGYYTDPECTQPFYAENPVTKDTTVYAKYEEMGSTEELNFTSFAQMDQSPDIRFEIVGEGDPAQAVTLEVKDGSDPVELKIEEIDGGYLVSATEGFNEGCSYQLHLADGWTFKDKPETIRTATFSIAMEQVENMQMSDDIVYILDTDAITYTVGGQSYDMLTSELITEQGGSFTYTGAAIEADDILCIYTGTHPEERNFDGDMLDPAFYVKAKAISGSIVTFTAMGESDILRLYNIPDNFPIKVDALPTETVGTVNISALDAQMYTTMMGDGYDLAKAKGEIEVGDFISVYVSMDSSSTDDDVYFGEITAYNAATGEITFKKTTKQAILDCMDLYRDVEVSGDDLITEEQKEEIEEVVLNQIQDSGFAEDAAFMLADMVAKTDGFKNASLQSLMITDSQGNEIDPEALQLMNLGKTFELTDDVKLTVEIITKGNQLHYKKGTQIAVGVEAEFAVELEDDEKIAIELSATFVQEVMISPKIKGYVVPYFVGPIPLPVGANLNGTVDINSFTAFSFAATVYTVGPEDESLWDQLKDVMKDPKKLAELEGLPDELVEGLNTAGDVLDKIKEMKDELSKMKGTADEVLGTAEECRKNIELLWETVDHVITEEDYSAICEALDQTNVTSDLLDMMELTNKTGLQTEYYESMEALMERYCEMVEKETDWVTLLEKDIFEKDVCVYGVAIGIDVDFLVRADLSLAIGSNLQYEVGKRYEFWFKFAPFWKKAGCESMDLLDERFAFQFYVMGRLGLKAGIKAKLECGIGSCIAANAGVSIELGPYMKLWGFFVYEYEKHRAANTDKWYSDERMAGALLMEFGLYLKMAFEAEAIAGMFSYEYEFMDKEIPLLTVGEEKFYYQPNYEPAEDELLIIDDVDDNSQNGITMTLPNYTLALDYVDMRSGYMAIESLDYDRYYYTVSNPNFSVDPKTGEISVNVPEGTRYMECDLTITYKYGKLAFSTYDMSVTVPLVWTNMADAELSEYYTASVRVGNDVDGYTTVWSKRVLKNSEFDLPTVEELQKLMGWNEYKYDMGTGYGNRQIEDLVLIEDEVYDFNIAYDTYSITVNGVQNADGSTTSRTFTAKFGEIFDFSELEGTGTTNYANSVFTKFSGLTAPEGIDLSKAIDTRMAAALANGVTATANYVDNSVTATFIFNGIDAEEVTIKLRRGDIPTLTAVEAIVTRYGMAIKEITPVIAPATSSVLYQVICGELNTPPATITFVENGGSEVADITKPYGSLIGILPTPERAGHTFEGWYTDKALTQLFTETKMPEGGLTLYAKWTANEYTVTLHVNGGNAPAANTLTVTYGTAYGELPKPERTGYGFVGWFTAAQGGKLITAESLYAVSGNQTLYAQWRELKEISADVFDFGQQERYTYQRYTSRNPGYTFSPVSGESYTVDDFTFSYIAEGYEDEGYVSEVINSGTWGVKVTRPADDYYAKFEAFYPGVLAIEKGTRNNGGPYVGMKTDFDNYSTEAQGITRIGVRLVAQGYSGCHIVDPDPNLQVRLAAFPHKEAGYSQAPDISTAISISDYVPYPEAADVTMDQLTYSQLIYLHDLQPDTKYTVFVEVTGDRNYEDMYFQGFDCDDSSDVALGYLHDHIATKAPIYTWTNFSDTGWYNTTDSEFVITTPAQLAGLAKLVNDGTDSFFRKTVKLGANVDVSECIWVPIGTTSTNCFRGTFDGQGYTVSGVYYNNSSADNIGLFGYIEGAYDLADGVMRYATIKDLVLDDSYIYARSVVGGMVGFASVAEIRNCTNYAYVKAYQQSKGNDYKSAAGGIVGWTKNSFVYDCVNYGTVYSEGRLTGGIVGLTEAVSIILNNANFGSVTGSSRVGGIVGCMDGDETETLNNYNVGAVRPNDGSNDYIGAIVGRNVNDNGVAEFNYYLYGCAKGGNGKVRAAMGKDGGSVEDGKKGYAASSFTTPGSTLYSSAGEYGSGKTLINALNDYIEGVAVVFEWWEIEPSRWVADDDESYPLIAGSHFSALRK